MKINTMLKVNKTIILICIINIIFSFFLLLRDRIILNLDSDNKDIVSSFLKHEIDDSTLITKVSFDRVWSNAIIYVHYSNLKVDKLIINEGDFALGDLADYIKIYGYKESDIAIMLGLCSITIIIFSVVFQLLLTKRKKVA